MERAAVVVTVHYLSSWVCAAAFFILGAIAIVYRSTGNRRKLTGVKNYIRNDASYFLSKSTNNFNRRLVEEGTKINESLVKEIPQFNRVIPPLVVNSHDSKEECNLMLMKIRAALKKTHEHRADLMSMRSCLTCVDGTWPVEEGERFLRTYEKIVFGSFRKATSQVTLTNEEIQFMIVFFYHKVMQEL